jgi:hypothetical protein
VTYFDRRANPLPLATLLVSSLSLWVACRASPASPSGTLEEMILIPGDRFIMESQDGPSSSRPEREFFREPTGSLGPLAGTP